MKIILFLMLFSFGSSSFGTPVGATFPRDEFIEISKGKRSGHSIIQKFGHNTDVDTATVPEDIWNGGGAYTGFPSELEKVEAFSADAADADGGTGCRSIQVYGLDSNFDYQTESITLNGTTGVQSVNIYSRLNRVRCSSAGSGFHNAGEITVRHITTTANVFSVMPLGSGQSHIGCYTVPNGYTGYLVRYRYSMFDSTANRAAVVFHSRNGNNTHYNIRPTSVSTSHSPTIDIVGSLVFPEKTDGCGRVTAVDNNNGNINFSFEMVLVKN